MTYAIGDIHGELQRLWQLLNLLEPVMVDEDTLVFLGDYIDRGPDSAGVIELLSGFREQHANTVFLRGNHDLAMLQARDIFDNSRTSDRSYEDISWWFTYGGRETLASYGITQGRWSENVPDHHWRFLEETIYEYTEGAYKFVHAGVLPKGLRWEMKDDPRVWVRDEFIRSTEDFGKIIVFGHTPQTSGKPLLMRNKIGIDTAVAYGGPLTAVGLDATDPTIEPVFYQV